MASPDIGIDLGTSTILAGNRSGVLLCEPSVVAVRKKTGEILAVGTDVDKMIGRAPDAIEVIHPLRGGTILDYRLTGVLIRSVLKKIYRNMLLRPRLIVCIPSAVTSVESGAVIDAALREAGAREVILIEEPVAAALGAGLDITKPTGNLVVNIGGGTTDAAVLSLRGVVCKTSIKTAGIDFDGVVAGYVRSRYNLLIGERTAEETKKQIGSVWLGDENPVLEVKGRDLLRGMPGKVAVHRSEMIPQLREIAGTIRLAIQNMLEFTPPELAGDIHRAGMLLTGGGALLHGLEQYLSQNLGLQVTLVQNPVDCVVLGTVQGFSHIDDLHEGILQMKNRGRH